MTTLFISDLHLQEERPEITRAFFAFLDAHARQADQLYILGDFFEVWIGDDCITDFQKEIIDALKALSQSCDLFFMHGNRDFLIGDHFANLAGACLLNDPSVITLNGTPTLLSHGDALCLDDQAYQQFRAMVRNPDWQQEFLAKPLEERLAIARQLRDKSREETAEKSDEITDVSPGEVIRTMTAHGCPRMIHGHTHRPACHSLTLTNADGAHVPGERMVLGDWGDTGWFIQADSQGIELKEFVPDQAGTPL